MRLRRQKIVVRALVDAEGSEPEGLTAPEHELYGRIRGMQKEEEEQLASMLHPITAVGMGAQMAGGAENAQVENGPNGKHAPENGNGGLIKKEITETVSAPVASQKKVRILKDIPAYRGADNSTYGPFTTGQETELPPTEAEWMMNGQMACAIGPGGESVMYVTQAVKILKVYTEMDVPAYEGPDGKTYGPFKKGERVMLPEPEARHLIRLKLGMESD